MRTTRQTQRSRGAAMLLVLIAVAIATILALSFLASQGPTSAVAKNIDRKAKARQIAESALKMGIDYVNEDANWRTDKTSGQWITAASLDGGTFDLYGIDADDGDLSDDSSEPVTIQVVASYQGVTHRVSAIVTPGSGGSSSSLLLVVGDSGSLTAGDTAKQALFASWGYTVTTIDDDDSQAAFDTAAADNDVAFVSESCNSGSVGTKLRDTTIGVVCDESQLNDEFGFTSGATGSESSMTAIDIVDNSHPITTGFSAGSLTILDSSFNIRYATTTVASGVDVLADRQWSGTNAALMAADTGATLHYGSAAGRRVMFGVDDNFDVGDLNSDGLTILQRSLDWAAGDNGPTLLALYDFEEQSVADPTLIGHWKLDEATDPGVGGISAGDKIELKGTARIDSYNSADGTYASQTPGTAAVVTTNSTEKDKFKTESGTYIGGDGYIGEDGSGAGDDAWDIDGTLTGSRNVLDANIQITTLTDPSGMPSSSGNLSRSSGNLTISSDVRYGTFTLSSSATVTISGDVRMWVTGDLDMTGTSQIIVPDGSTLTLYTGDDVDIEDDAFVNPDTSAPEKVTIYGIGNKHIDLKDDAQMSAIVYTNDELHIKDDTHFYGKVLASDKVKAEGDAEIHYDTRLGGFPVSSGGGSGGAAVQIKDEITIQNTAFIDGYDATAGVYSSSNRYLDTSVSTNGTSDDDIHMNNADIYGDVYVGSGGDLDDVIRLENGSSISGSQSAQSSNVTIPNPGTPSGFGSDDGNTTYDNNDVTWSSNQHFDDLTIRNTSVVTVSGNVEVRVSGRLNLDNADIELDPGATLTIHVGDNITVQNTSTINNDTTRPMDVTISQYGDNKDVTMDNATVVGSLHVSDDFTIRNSSHLYASTVTVEDDLIMDNAEIHIHTASSGGSALSEDGTYVETAADETSTSNDGSVNGTMTGGASGVIDNAYDFDGSDDYVQIPHDASYLLDAGTISLHFYPTTTSSVGGLFSKDASGQGNGGHVRIYRDGTRISAIIETTSDDPYGTGSTITLQSNTGVVTQDTWNHVALTWGDGQARLYHDGVLVASENHLGGLGTTSGGAGNTEPIVIGANTHNSSAGTGAPREQYFTGRIDDVRIYDLPVDAGQAANLAAGSDPGSRTAPGYIALDTSGYDTAANLIVYDATAISWDAGGGLEFTGDTLATTLGSVSKIHDAIEANGEFAVELIVERMTPGSTDSPSHIVGYSNAPTTHNFLIGQDGSDYEARVRDDATGTSGVLSPEYISTTNLASSGETHVVLSYSGGTVTTYVDGVLDKTESTGGTLDNWASDLLLVIGAAYDDTNHWNGTIKRLAIYDESFNSSQADNVYNGLEPGTGESGLGSVDWEEED